MHKMVQQSAGVEKMLNAMLGCSIMGLRFNEIAVADGEGKATA